MKKILIALMIISLLAMAGCGTTEETKTSGEVMTTAAQYWPGQFWIDIAMKKGWFSEAGLQVEYVLDADIEFIETEKALADGDLVVHQLVLYDLITFLNEGKELVAVATSDISFGGDGIMTNPGINTMSDLKGKRIGVDKGSYSEFMLSAALSSSGLQYDDVLIVQAKAEEIDRLEKDLDAISVYEPFGFEATKKFNANKIFDTSDIPGLLPDVITFHKDFVEKNPQDVQAYVNVWHKTTQFMKENPDEAFGIISKRYNVSVEEVTAFAQLDKILDLQDNQIAFSYAAGFESLHGTAKRINDFMIDNGITDQDLDSTQFIDARFIRGVEE
jgi:NitT/TauT family transport system substrate-binding protein